MANELAPLCPLIKKGSFADNGTRVRLAMVAVNTRMVDITEIAIPPMTGRQKAAIEVNAAQCVLDDQLARVRQNGLQDLEGLQAMHVGIGLDHNWQINKCNEKQQNLKFCSIFKIIN